MAHDEQLDRLGILGEVVQGVAVDGDRLDVEIGIARPPFAPGGGRAAPSPAGCRRPRRGRRGCRCTEIARWSSTRSGAPRSRASSSRASQTPSLVGDPSTSATTQPCCAGRGSCPRMMATGQWADAASAAAVEPTRPWCCARVPSSRRRASPPIWRLQQRTRRSVLQDLDFDLDRLIGRLDRHERMPDGYLGGRRDRVLRLGDRAGASVGVDRVDEPQRDIATDRLVDGPQARHRAPIVSRRCRRRLRAVMSRGAACRLLRWRHRFRRYRRAARARGESPCEVIGPWI